MKIGILGSGVVAKALGGGFLAHGHEVMLGTRDRVKLEGWLAQHAGSAAGTFADAARFGELLVLAVKGTAAAEALGSRRQRQPRRQDRSSTRRTRSPTRRPSTAC